jgi:hypothetical protein
MKAGFCTFWTQKVSSRLWLIPLLAGIMSCHTNQQPPVSEPRPQAKNVATDVARKISDPSSSKNEQKAWKENPGYTVLLTSAPSSDLANKAVLTVLKDGAVVAQATDKDKSCDLADDYLYGGKDGTACSVALDLAPYRISESEFAIGVRWHQDETFPAGENNAEVLRLWRLSAGMLSKILDTQMRDSDEQRGPNEESEERCTLNVSETKSLGYDDLVKKCTSVTGPLMDDPDDRQDRPTRSSSIETLFKWDGSKYVEQKSRTTSN